MIIENKMYLNQLENSKRLRKEQYKELKRLERIQKQMSSYMNTHTQIGCYMTGQAMISTTVAPRYDLAQYHNSMLNQFQQPIYSRFQQQLEGLRGQAAQAGVSQGGLASFESGRISKSFDQEARPAQKQATQATQEAVKESANPKLTLESSPLFGRAQFGRFYKWRFDNPINVLRMWLFRRMYKAQRGFS